MRNSQRHAGVPPAAKQSHAGDRLGTMPMRIDILTLFPEMFGPVLSASIIGRAVAAGLVEIRRRTSGILRPTGTGKWMTPPSAAGRAW